MLLFVILVTSHADKFLFINFLKIFTFFKIGTIYNMQVNFLEIICYLKIFLVLLHRNQNFDTIY